MCVDRGGGGGSGGQSSAPKANDLDGITNYGRQVTGDWTEGNDAKILVDGIGYRDKYGQKVYREGFRWSSRDQAHAKTIYGPTKSEIQTAVKKISSDFGVRVNNLYDVRVDRF